MSPVPANPAELPYAELKRMLTEDDRLSPLEARAAARAAGEWLAILKVDKGNFSWVVWPPSPVDVLKSSLLMRLLSGKPALEHAPPTSHAYPWYNLVDEDRAHPCQVLVDESPAQGLPADRVFVDNCSWDIVSHLKPDEYLVRWRWLTCRLWKEGGGWLIRRVVPDAPHTQPQPNPQGS